MAKSLDYPELMGFTEVYTQIYGKPPSGLKYEALKAANMASQNLNRVALLPPNSPNESVLAMRQAFTVLAKDEEFIAEAKKVMVIMNAATSIIVDKSPYCTRTSFTLPMVTTTLGQWAAKNGIKKAYTMVSDYAPGHDAEQGFINGFKAGGGEIVGSVRMAVANPDFSAYVQRAKDLNPEAIFVFIPGGAQPAAIGKAFAERGIDTKKTKVLGTGELTDDSALKQMGDAAQGIITAWNYDHNTKSKLNQEFVAGFKKISKGVNPNFLAAGGYDGMHLIYAALKKTKGNADAAALTKAAAGMKWESPRGPMMIDPETRDAVETIYIRRVEKVGGKLTNVVIDKIPDVKDPVKEAMKKK